jgi:hypothetical protein
VGSDSSTVPHTILDHAAVQANVLDYVIVQFRKQPHVAADAQLPAIAVTSDRKPRAAAARQASKIVAWRPRGMGERTVEASYMSASIELASESRFQIRRDTIGPVRQHVGAFPTRQHGSRGRVTGRWSVYERRLAVALMHGSSSVPMPSSRHARRPQELFTLDLAGSDPPIT